MFNTDLLKILLIDRTTNKNIIWATDDYNDQGEKFGATKEILIDSIDVIKPQYSKSAQNKKNRIRNKAEIFTPSWICNEQNQLIQNSFQSWQKYVDAKILEITCGEATYLVNRYDAVTGEEISIDNRIGLLDRKIHLISKNISNKSDWIEWTEHAFKSTYGYEFHGDSLFIARKNLLLTYVDYYQDKFKFDPDEKLLQEIAEIISWNLWQMNGLTNSIPYSKIDISLFEQDVDKNIHCIVKDWTTNQIIEFKNI